MRPTFSIICFTVLSGAGYGLWFLMGLALTVLWPHCGPMKPGDSLTLCLYSHALIYGLTVGFALVSLGLIASLGHLGQPQRAWRALSQWRSSWLSREGIAAIATYLPAITLIALLVFSAAFPLRTAFRFDSSLLQPIGAALALGAVLTVFCTAHIYSSLQPIRAWHNRHVVPGYLLLGLHSGALVLWGLATLPASASFHIDETPALLVGFIVTATACALLKLSYWRQIDRLPEATAGHATGLSAIGATRSFEQPHTEENYLTHEMGFVLARKHARKLRRITLILGFLVPAVLAVFALAVPALRTPAAWVALVAGLAGLFVERWLFFAEAKHAVMAYYAR